MGLWLHDWGGFDLVMEMKMEKDDTRRRLQDIFEETQASLPQEDRASKLDGAICGAGFLRFRCTKILGHSGEHCAHGVLGDIIHRWQQ